MVLVSTGSIQELRLSPNRESSAHQRIDDFRNRGFLVVKHNDRLVVGFLHIPCQIIREHSLFRFQDKPYPVTGIPSPSGKRHMDLEQDRLVGPGGC